MSGNNNELGWREENERKSRRNKSLLWAVIVLGLLGLVACWYLKVGPFNKPVPAPTPAKVAATIPKYAPAPTPTPSPTPTKDAKAKGGKHSAKKK